MVLIIIIKAVTRKAVMIMMLMIQVMRKEEEGGWRRGRGVPSRKKGLLRRVLKIERDTRSEKRSFPKLGRGTREDSTSKDTDINFGICSLPSMC